MRDDTTNLYINFVLHAIFGLLAEADGLMRKYGERIRIAADALTFAIPTSPRTLYRGVLLDPSRPFALDSRTFASWSESPDVARWFACPRSVISEPLASTNAKLVGHLVELSSATSRRVLFHHTWARAFGGLSSLARRHPRMGDSGAAQIAWSLETQREVITEPLPVTPKLAPELDAETLAALERRFSPPWIVEREGVRI